MKITQAQYSRIEHLMPRPRGSFSISNLNVLNAILYVLENGSKWRALPEHFGNWHTIYTRMNRWSKNGVLDQVFIALQQEQIIKFKVEFASLDSTTAKVHPDGMGALKKTALNQSANQREGGQPRFIWLPRLLQQP